MPGGEARGPRRGHRSSGRARGLNDFSSRCSRLGRVRPRRRGRRRQDHPLAGRRRGGSGIGYRVLETQPAAAEARLAFAGLGDLLDVGLGAARRAPAAPGGRASRRPPTRAPRGARRTSGRSPSPSLNALRIYAAERPLLVAIDDVQWLDSPSAAVLAFAWRRLREEPAGLLVAHRLGSDGTL